MHLSSSQIRELGERAPRATIRIFNFSQYPDYMDMEKRAKGEYAWKPVIIREMLDTTASAVLWLDSSVKAQDSKTIGKIMKQIEDVGYVTSRTSGDMRKWVHPGMLSYLNLSRDFNGPMCNGAVVGFSGKQNAVYEKLVVPWEECALVEECIAPRGSSRANHRQDQAALSVLMKMSGRNCGKAEGLKTHLR